MGIFSSFYRNFIFIRFFFLPFFLLLKDSFKSIFLKTPLVLILVFLATLVFYVRLALFYFTYEGTFSFTSFFFCLPFCLLRGEGGGNFAISEETLNTFNIFLRAYQSSFTRGAYLTARAFSFAVGVSRWTLATTEADMLPM